LLKGKPLPRRSGGIGSKKGGNEYRFLDKLGMTEV